MRVAQRRQALDRRALQHGSGRYCRPAAWRDCPLLAGPVNAKLPLTIFFLGSIVPTTNEFETDPKQGGTAYGERGRNYQQHKGAEHLILLTRSDDVSYRIICHHHKKPAAAYMNRCHRAARF
jgi:hypothetical protein